VYKPVSPPRSVYDDAEAQARLGRINHHSGIWAALQNMDLVSKPYMKNMESEEEDLC